MEKPKINLRIIGSGSSGNATLFNISGHDTWLLFDCGVPYMAKQIADYNVSAVLVTHCHSDHCGKVKYIKDIPIYGTYDELTDERVTKTYVMSKNKPEFKFIDVGEWFFIDDYAIIALDAAHDTPNPCHYFVSDGVRSFFYGCDTGYIQDELDEYFDSSDVIMIECDYDSDSMETDMINGREVNYLYSDELKQRVIGTHCNNEYISRRMRKYLLSNDHVVILSHISITYNSPETVLEKMNWLVDEVITRDTCPTTLTL